jgi:hypothetical protein
VKRFDDEVKRFDDEVKRFKIKPARPLKGCAG